MKSKTLLLGFFGFGFEIGSLKVAQTSLELTLKSMQASNI